METEQFLRVATYSTIEQVLILSVSSVAKSDAKGTLLGQAKVASLKNPLLCS